MSNLVPQKKQDKNGHLVTRYVKDEASGKKQVPSLPGPAAPATSAALPAGAKILTAEDLNLIARLINLCSENSDDLMHLNVHIGSGDMRSLRVFDANPSENFSTIQDILYYTDSLYEKGEEIAGSASFEAHLKVAEESSFEYFNGGDNDAEVIRLIHQNPDQVDSIIEFLDTRGSDAWALRQYLENGVKVLRGGTL